MKFIRLTSVVSVLSLLPAVTSAGETFDISGSGTLIANATDSNGDGIRGLTVQATLGSGGSPKKAWSMTGITETLLTGVSSPRCPALADHEFIQHAVVFTDASGNQIFGELSSGHACVGFGAPMIFSLEWEHVIVGGSGAYEGATGTISTQGAGRALHLTSQVELASISVTSTIHLE